MGRVSIWVVSVTLFLLFLTSSSEEEEVKQALVQFMEKLSPGNLEIREPSFGWNASSDPCKDKWQGVSCDDQLISVKKIVLDRFNLSGVIDAASLCKSRSLLVLSLVENNVGGELPKEISNCLNLTHLYLTKNRFSGNLPENLFQLSNLKRVDASSNGLSGNLPDLSKILGLISFLGQNNHLTGEIPEFDFSNLQQFNVSNNNLTGPIPDVNGKFSSSSFLGNPGLCGPPLPNTCPPPNKYSKGFSKNELIMYSGYGILGLAFVLLVAFRLLKKKEAVNEKLDDVKKGEQVDNSSDTSSFASRNGGNWKSQYSITSGESGKVSTSSSSSSLVVLLSSDLVVSGLRFEELLQAPAEMVGRSKHGSLYRVGLSNGGGVLSLAVKRVMNWGISRADFEKRMDRIDQARHPNVLPVVAYYCSKQEKLLVYEFQQNGNLFKLLHGSQNGQVFGWGSRISVVASIAEALAFMHESLYDDGIAHGNLKSSNILLNKDMSPCLSEYGLMVVPQKHDTYKFKDCTFKADVYALGVILLELLTGKLVQSNGFDLAEWVQSVVREERTFEAFDHALLSDGGSEDRMVNLLHMALKCINPSPDDRPRIDQVVSMVNSIKQEEDQRSIASGP